MSFTASFATRHTDAFAGTGFVHAGVLLALTELAYAAFEKHVGLTKPGHIVAVERETRATFAAPLRWEDGAAIEVTTTRANERGFTQEFAVRSQASGAQIATFVHDWVWLDTDTGRRVDLSAETQQRLLGMAA